jgi:hypothetical protein
MNQVKLKQKALNTLLILLVIFIFTLMDKYFKLRVRTTLVAVANVAAVSMESITSFSFSIRSSTAKFQCKPERIGINIWGKTCLFQGPNVRIQKLRIGGSHVGAT